MDKARMFREAAQRHNEGRDRYGWRYPPELRALAVEYYESVQDGGVAPAAAALGISPMSLTEWLSSPVGSSRTLPVPQEEPSPPSLLPVRTATVQVTGASMGPRPLALDAVTPGGLRIEGLDWARVLDLVRVFG